MKYALNLGENKRILSACIVLPNTPDTMPMVDSLPDGDITDYRYDGGKFIYDPIPEPVVYATADRNYNKGDVATIDGVMYEFLANVPRGVKLVVGQNVAVTSFDEQIAKLKGE